MEIEIMFPSILFVKTEGLFTGVFFFPLFQNSSTTTLKWLGLLFVLQPTQHGLIMCKCCQKVEVTPGKCCKQQDFAGGTGLTERCLLCVGIVSFKGIVSLDLFVNPHLTNNI